jgi:hypothetical protein
MSTSRRRVSAAHRTRRPAKPWSAQILTTVGSSEIRILFVFDPWRSAVLLVAGNKSGKWNRWYTEAIPHAEQLYEIYLKERANEEKGR